MTTTTDHQGRGELPDRDATVELRPPDGTGGVVPGPNVGPHIAYDMRTELLAGNEVPLRQEVDGAVRERRRELHRSTVDDRLSLLGSALAAFALVWVLYYRLLPFSGLFGFVVSWYLVFLALYAWVTALRHGRPQVVDRVMTAVVYGGALVVGGALALVVVSTVWQGRTALAHANFFTTDLAVAGPLSPLTVGGVLHAVIGTLIEVAITVVITLPLGVLTAVYLNEIGGRGARLVRTVVEAMTALPDVLAGLFVYIALLVALGVPQSGFAAAVALSITMLPITARAAEVVLRVVPGGLREASLAQAAGQWRTVWRVVLPTARPGLVTALILGVARGIGETAPVLLTAGATTLVNANPFAGSMASLPLVAYTLVRSPEPTDVARGFGAASVLLVLIVLLFVIARIAGGNRAGRR